MTKNDGGDEIDVSDMVLKEETIVCPCCKSKIVEIMPDDGKPYGQPRVLLDAKDRKKVNGVRAEFRKRQVRLIRKREFKD